MSPSTSFRTYWLGQAVSNVGDGFSMVALPLLVLEASGSIAQMVMVTAARAVANALTALVVGGVIDRAHRRRLMMGCDTARFVLLLGLALTWLSGHHPMALLYVVVTATAALGNMFLVGSIAAVANLVEVGDLTAAQSRLQGSQALAYVVGPALAGVVAARFGVAWAVLVDACSFAVSAATLSAIRFRQDRPPEQAARRGVLADLATGFRFLFGNRLLAAMTAVTLPVALLNCGGLSGAGAIDLVIFHLRHDLGRGEKTVGLCLAVAALGAVAGAVTVPMVRRRLGFGACFLGGTAVQAVGLTFMGAVGTVAATAIGAGVWAAGLMLRVVPTVAVRQAIIPDALVGRVTAASWLIVFAGSALGGAVISRVAAVVPVTRVMTGLGVLVMVVVVAASFSEIRRHR